MNKIMNAKITIEMACTCNEGFVDARYCVVCATVFDDTIDWDAETLPCGCRWSNLVESDVCPECEGSGKITKQITLEQLSQAVTTWQARAI